MKPERIIVCFTRYASASAAARILRSALGPSSDWRVLKRKNPAFALPSDFAVVVLSGAPSRRAAALVDLREHAAVRWVGPDAPMGPRTPLQHVPPAKRHRGRAIDPRGFCLEAGGCAPPNTSAAPTRRPLYAVASAPPPPPTAAERLGASELWREGLTGAGVRVAVFDTGLRAGHPHMRRVEEITNWTDEADDDDGVGHGTFVAGVIGSSDDECAGLAPDALLYIFKVFNAKQMSYTSWFLDAFNYALHKRVHILNLSIGGPDFADRPFVQKVNEVSANNILVVSGNGNAGPLFGTVMSPADQPDVLAVGGIENDGRLAEFSSRGMTAWEVPDGYGRVKPDILTYGAAVPGSATHGGCRSLSGTSVACPVVAGAAALLASAGSEGVRWRLLNPAAMKQLLVGGARRLAGRSAYEQGGGAMDLRASRELLRRYVPAATVIPPELDLAGCAADGAAAPAAAEAGGEYLWPLCAQPLWFGALPLLANLTVVNALSLVGNFSRPPTFEPASDADGARLGVAFEHSRKLWPWGGTIGVALHVLPGAAAFDGLVRGAIVFEVQAVGAAATGAPATSAVRVPLTVRVVPPPPRRRRLLFDASHSLRYPPAYLPRDNLEVTEELLDWTGDHLHTNFRDLFIFLRQSGYYAQTLGCPLTCVNASAWGALVLADTEAPFTAAERAKLAHDVTWGGLGVVVFAEWYSAAVLRQLRFYDENTHSTWTPLTGGANLPALNALLAPWGIAFGDGALMGELAVGDGATRRVARIASGTSIDRWPAGGHLARTAYLHDEGAQLTASGAAALLPASLGARLRRDVAVVGLLQPRAPTAGRLAAFVDTECLDSTWRLQQPKMEAAAGQACWWLLRLLLDFALDGARDDALLSQLTPPAAEPLRRAWSSAQPLPAADDAGALALLDRGVRDPRGERPAECLPSRLGLTPPAAALQPPREGLLPLETFGALAHWPYAARGEGEEDGAPPAPTPPGAVVGAATAVVLVALGGVVLLLRRRRRGKRRRAPTARYEG